MLPKVIVTRTALAIALTISTTSVFAAQQPKPTFEVASVKPQRSPVTWANPPGLLRPIEPGGVFNAPRVTVADLLIFAYDLRDYQLVGGPDWVREDWFEIDARARSDAPADQIKMMLRSLLEERFELVSHIEPREMQYQALVLARSDGALGPRLFRMDVECAGGVTAELRRAAPEKYPTPSGGGMTSNCSLVGVTSLADYLYFRLGTPVVDATGLKDSHYYTVISQWPPGRGTLPEVSDPSLPALTTALSEQLGLKLESRKGPVDVLVIDSAQQPTQN